LTTQATRGWDGIKIGAEKVTENTKRLSLKASENVVAGTTYLVDGTKQGVSTISSKIDENETLSSGITTVKTGAGVAWGATAAAASTAKASIDTKIEANPTLSNAKAKTDGAVKQASSFMGKAWGSIWGGGPEPE
jgi:hypothetical protein